MITDLDKGKTKSNNKKYTDSQEIVIKGARQHNLKNIDITFPKNKLIVVTGVSGSGKSSLCMDTLFAEGQRRYVESLSSYARQFLMRMNKPDVDYIKGLCPAIAIEQKVTTRTTRSTVGSLTEIYDYLRLLFSRAGITYSPVSGKEVIKHEVRDVVDYVFSFPKGSKIIISYPAKVHDSLISTLQLLEKKGFTRVEIGNKMAKVEDFVEEYQTKKSSKIKSINVVVDRLILTEKNEDNESRAADSVQIAFFEGFGDCIVEVDEKESTTFSNRFELDGLVFEQPTEHFFNSNSPFGACKRCEGFGSIIGVDADLVFPNKNLSVYDGAIACWRGEKMSTWLKKLLKSASEFKFPIHRPINELTEKQYDLLWKGNKYFDGIDAFFESLEANSYKIQYRVLLSRYRGKTNCPECKGTRLRKDSSYVKIADKSITEVLLMPIDELQQFFEKLKLSDHQEQIARRILVEINNRLRVMMDVGLGYLSLNRLSNTLSGGETQRINLTRSLGSNLTESLYVLDEPSIGLHPKDTERLIKVLKSLRDLGNTVIVVEHDEEMMRASDHLVDMGPLAGRLGGEVVYSGPSRYILTDKKSLTAKYLNGELKVTSPVNKRKAINNLIIEGASQFNLKNITVTFPLNVLTVVTGVSGSGKTTLVKKILYPAMKRKVEGFGDKPGIFSDLAGDVEAIKNVEYIDQNPLGRSSRSNPVTYVKAYDAIRDHYSKQQLSKIRGYKPKHFSFNVDGGRCEACKGEGEVVVEMQFLADVHLECESCRGKRFKDEVLEVQYNDRNIYHVLEMTVDEALDFFSDVDEITSKLQSLQDIGLGYIKLGQSSSTLSGGEAQRVKLASFLNRGGTPDPILFIFDEPTTGLHFYDIQKLLDAFNRLIERGHSIVVIEHNLDVIAAADWIIDLGPEGGHRGGHLLYQGPVEGILKIKKSFTATFLKEKISN